MRDLRELESMIRAAISYAPIGTRDGASEALVEIMAATRTYTIQETPTLLCLQAEVNELKGFAEETIDSLTRIRQGGPHLAGGTFEGEARSVMLRLAKTIIKYRRKEFSHEEKRSAS